MVFPLNSCASEPLSDGLKFTKFGDYVTSIVIDDKKCSDFIAGETMFFFQNANVLSQACSASGGWMVGQFYSVETGKLLYKFPFPKKLYKEKTNSDVSWDLLDPEIIMFGIGGEKKYGFIYIDQYVPEYPNGTIDIVLGDNIDNSKYNNTSFKYDVNSFPNVHIVGNCLSINHNQHVNDNLYQDITEIFDLSENKMKAEIALSQDGKSLTMKSCNFYKVDNGKFLNVTYAAPMSVPDGSRTYPIYYKQKYEFDDNNNPRLVKNEIFDLGTNSIDNKNENYYDADLAWNGFQVKNNKIYALDDEFKRREWNAPKDVLEPESIKDSVYSLKTEHRLLRNYENAEITILTLYNEKGCLGFKCPDAQNPIYSNLIITKCKDACKAISLGSFPIISLGLNPIIVKQNSNETIYTTAISLDGKGENQHTLLKINVPNDYFMK